MGLFNVFFILISIFNFLLSIFFNFHISFLPFLILSFLSLHSLFLSFHLSFPSGISFSFCSYSFCFPFSLFHSFYLFLFIFIFPSFSFFFFVILTFLAQNSFCLLFHLCSSLISFFLFISVHSVFLSVCSSYLSFQPFFSNIYCLESFACIIPYCLRNHFSTAHVQVFYSIKRDLSVCFGHILSLANIMELEHLDQVQPVFFI